ncbi:helix-turn-helix domain-containing protein [Proteiniphilum sp.]|jgi:hypothetical protein|uniref:helix-turn-helix domain-containing protein n=1 Tax=Proteiniphilum sp. TaxID=1926877 RepID=UPI00332D9DB4
MKIINIEESVFEKMMDRFGAFTRKVEAICNRNSDKSMAKWLDNQDVCMILNISKRSLQNYRDNGILPYTQIRHKMYYKADDIERIIPFITQKEKELTYKRKERK